MRRIRTIALCGIALAGLNTLPSHAQDSGEPAEVMHWWTAGGEAAGVRVFADAFNERGGEWADSATAGGEALRAAAINRIAGGNPPAASQFNTGRQFDDLVASNLLSDLSALAEAGDWAGVMPASIVEAATRDGAFYALPVNIHGHNWVFYNREVLQGAGIQELASDVEGFFAQLDQLREAGITPIAWGGQAWQEANVFDTLLLAQGGPDLYNRIYRDKDPEAANSPEFIQVAESFGRLRDYVDAGAPGRNWNDASNMVITGQAAFQFQGDWAKGEFTAAGITPGEEIGCSVMPGIESYIMGGDVFVFPALGGQEPTAAQALLAETMLDPTVQIEFNTLKGSVPVRTDVDTSAMDSCAQTGVELVRDPERHVPARVFLVTADTSGQVQDAITTYFTDPSASAEDFAANFADILSAAD